MKEDDPLIPLGKAWKDSKTPHRNSWVVVAGWTRYTFSAATMFGVTSALFVLFYHSRPRLLIGIVGFFVLGFLSDALFHFTRHMQITKKAIVFVLYALAFLAGGVVGTCIHLTELTDYWPYLQLRHYTNVAPDDSAAAHSDASVLVFMDGARPDGSRSIGYKRGGTRYCVAPIALKGSYSADVVEQTDIQYWAVGTDCCMGQEGFTCDDADKATARSGLVEMDKRGMDRVPFLSSADMHYYRQAVNMAMSTFDLTSPKERLFVRFVEDIDAARDASWRNAWMTWLKWNCVWLPLWIGGGALVIVLGRSVDPRESLDEHLKDAASGIFAKANQYI